MCQPVMKMVSVLKDMSSASQSGVSYTSDVATYPHDLAQVPEDAYAGQQAVLFVHKQGYAYHDDQITFMVSGNFRAYDQLIEGDPHSITMPVLANVGVHLEQVKKAGLTTLEVGFAAYPTPYGTPEDPRIRFHCEGHYDPAGSGDTRFAAVVEVDQHANVNVIEGHVVGGDGELTDNSPAGFAMGVND